MAISAEEDVLKQRMLCNFRSVNGFIFVVVIYSQVESIRFTALVTSWYLFILSRPYYISNDVLYHSIFYEREYMFTFNFDGKQKRINNVSCV